MNSILPYPSPRTFFVLHDDDLMSEGRRQLSEQVLQMVYFGKFSGEFVSSLEVEERNFMYRLLSEQIEKENKQAKEDIQKAKSSGKRPSIPKGRR